MLDEYRRRRDNLHEWLTADPRITCLKPAGAFYLFVDISELLSPDGIRTSAEFATRLLDEAHVALDRRRGVRRAGLPPHLVRHVDGTAARRGDPDSRLREEARRGRADARVASRA